MVDHRIPMRWWRSGRFWLLIAAIAVVMVLAGFGIASLGPSAP